MSLTVSQPADVDGLIDAALGAGASVLKPAAKSFWGYGGVVQAPDGAIWKVATSQKKNTGPASREIDDVVLLLGVADVAASKRFYVDHGLEVAKTGEAAFVDPDAPDEHLVAEASLDAIVALLKENARMELFCRYYVEGTLDAGSWRAVRDATLDRAGDVFTEQEILEIMDTARSVGVEVARERWRGHPDLTDADRAEMASAIDRYVAEIAELEDRLHRPNPGLLEDVLADLESDGADLQ
jgi:predicted lactoylglutathione lyase